MKMTSPFYLALVTTLLITSITLQTHISKLKQEKTEVKQTVESSFKEYKKRKELAEKAVKVFTITDQESYQETREELKNHLSKEMLKKFFPTKNWKIAPRNRLLLTIKNIDISEDERGYGIVYFNLLSQGFNRDRCAIITFNNYNTVVDIELIK